jgi:hypothetical protein
MGTERGVSRPWRQWRARIRSVVGLVRGRTAAAIRGRFSLSRSYWAATNRDDSSLFAVPPLWHSQTTEPFEAILIETIRLDSKRSDKY